MSRVKWDSHHGPAVNVKDYGKWQHDLPDELAQRIWDEYAEQFWRAAWAIATEHGYDGVWAEGRMGGWCKPYPMPTDPYRAWTLDEMSEDQLAEERKRFEAFGADIVELLDDVLADCQAAMSDKDRDLEERAQLLELGTPIIWCAS